MRLILPFKLFRGPPEKQGWSLQRSDRGVFSCNSQVLFVNFLTKPDIDQGVFSAGNEWLTRFQRSEKVSSFRAIRPLMLRAHDRIGIMGKWRGFVNVHGGKFRLAKKRGAANLIQPPSK